MPPLRREFQPPPPPMRQVLSNALGGLPLRTRSTGVRTIKTGAKANKCTSKHAGKTGHTVPALCKPGRTMAPTGRHGAESNDEWHRSDGSLANDITTSLVCNATRQKRSLSAPKYLKFTTLLTPYLAAAGQYPWPQQNPNLPPCWQKS